MCRFLQIETLEVQFIARWEHHLVIAGVEETLNPVWSEEEAGGSGSRVVHLVSVFGRCALKITSLKYISGNLSLVLSLVKTV